MKLLTEFTDKIEVLNESTPKGNVMYLEGPMIMTEALNRNGRKYPKGIMEKSVDKYNKEYVLERRAIGELNHPTRPFADPKEAAILIERLDWKGNDVIGKARVLDTPNGNIIKALMEAKFKMGVSTRGLGDVNKNTSIVESFLLNAIDAVDMPSGQVCYVNAMNESMEWTQTNEGVWVEKVNEEKALSLFMEKFEQMIHNMKKGSK